MATSRAGGGREEVSSVSSPGGQIENGNHVRLRFGSSNGCREARGRILTTTTTTPPPGPLTPGAMVFRVWLLYLSLSLPPVSAEGGSGRPWERREAAPTSSALLGKEHNQGLQSVRALSSRYWNLLACQLWSEACEGEEEKEDEENEVVAAAAAAMAVEERKEEAGGSRVVLEQPGWSFPIMKEILSSWYCSFGTCCATRDCKVTNNITGLDLDLSRRLHGQHLVKLVVVKAIQVFLETSEPKKALVLSFHGWSGTGKNFVARIIAEHLYRDGLKSECVKIYISLFHFPHFRYVDMYKVQLAKEISETVQLCMQSLFIFDEAEKLHTGLLDALKPYMDHYDNTDRMNYRRSIFLFLSNTGGNIINEVALDFWRAGRNREEITMEYLEPYLRSELMVAADEGPAQNHILEDNLIDLLVPFLPLEYRHVKLCARDAFLARGLPFNEEALDEVARMMVFVPKEEKLFSAQGCKTVSQRINYFLP
nr:torsin-3A isoform X2 [Pogona vitticeps]